MPSIVSITVPSASVPKIRQEQTSVPSTVTLHAPQSPVPPPSLVPVKNNSSRVEYEATTSKVDDEQLFYCRQRGMDEEEAVALVVNGFCKEVLQALPMEFAMEAQSLVAISLEGSVG